MMLSNVADAYDNAFRNLQAECAALMGRVMTEACQQLQGSENWEVDHENMQVSRLKVGRLVMWS